MPGATQRANSECFPRSRGDEPLGMSIQEAKIGFPRSRGDEPAGSLTSRVPTVFSPLTRG